MGISLEIYDSYGYQYFPTDYSGLQFGSVYGEEGGGFTICTLNLDRRPGFTYKDVGLGYRVKIRKYLNTFLFDGQIRSIEESGGENNEIVVTALGEIVVSEDDELLRAFCDTRISRFQPKTELEGGYFQPGKFSASYNPLGIYMHANNGTVIGDDEYTETVYEFFSGEVAERIRCDLSLVLGAGILMDADVDAIDDTNGYIDYTGGNGDVNVTADMTVRNKTQSKTATVQSINTGTDRITVTTPSAITGWASGDEIYVGGPTFRAVVDSISTDIITYIQDVGEANLSNGSVLANVNKKAVATIDSHDAGANTITVTDEDHLTGWDENDVIIQANASIFYATVASVANDGDGSGTVTWNSGTDTGASVVSANTGWMLYNQTKLDYAWVDAWNVGSRQVGAGDWNDISGWTNGDVLRIYAPLVATILDSNDTVIWPEGTDDVRISTVPHDRYKIDVTTAGSPTSFKLRVVNYVEGEYGETVFAQFSNVRVYSTEEEVTPDMLGEYLVGLLSAAGHDWDDSVDDIEVFKPFTAEVSSVVGPVLTYTGSSGESNVAAEDILYNTTQNEWAVVSSIDTGTNEITVTAYADIYGWNASDDIETRQLVEPMVHEFMTPRAAMAHACSFGDGTGARAAWGIRLDDRRRFYLEAWDTSTVKYIVRRSAAMNAGRGMTAQESWQQVRGVYTDSNGEMQVTDWQLDTDSYFNSKYRRKSLRLDSSDNETKADSLVAQWLSENKYPRVQSSYTVQDGAVFTPSGLPVPIEELRADGGLVRIEDWRSVSGARSSSDLRDSWTTEVIAGINIDYDARSAEIIPASPRSTFEVMVAELARMRNV